MRAHDKTEFAIPVDLHTLQNKFAAASTGDTRALNDSVYLIRQILANQIEEEEKLLINIEDDSRLELQLAIILPLLLFAIGQYFFRNNVLEPLDALRDLLSGLAEGVKQPISRETADPVLRDLFDRYNCLVAHLIEPEQEHINHTSLLEQQVRQTSHALLEQSNRLAKAERLAALTEMAASTAHELRNPLAIIQVALENIRSETTNPDMQQRIAMLHREVQHLNDLLTSARTSSETAHLTDVNEVISDLITLLNYQAVSSIDFIVCGVASTPKLLPETKFRQVLLNLLQNAAQAIGNDGGTIVVDVYQNRQQLSITIVDSGAGISPAFLHQGIRPFFSLKQKGSGLGLVMVQRFARDQGGQLKLENNLQGHGKVSLSLPMASA